MIDCVSGGGDLCPDSIVIPHIHCPSAHRLFWPSGTRVKLLIYDPQLFVRGEELVCVCEEGGIESTV